jgi:hypothetical protein
MISRDFLLRLMYAHPGAVRHREYPARMLFSFAARRIRWKDKSKKSKRILHVSHELLLVAFHAEKMSNIFVSGEQQRRALAESGVTVVANITKDRVLVAWAQDTGGAVYIGRNYRGRREAGWGNPFRPQTHAPEDNCLKSFDSAAINHA